ncbi:MAG: transcription-repair coupling factor [candidate division Zixibacteria bacterium]|nr:transcription-repair coupling factor [candidate division Zixibacteria bacterium]
MEKLTQNVTPATHLDAVRKVWLDHLPYRRLTDTLGENSGQTTTITGLSGSSLSFLLSALGDASKPPILVITQHAEESANLCDDLSFLLGTDRIGHFPARQILPFDFSAPQGEVMGRRISTLAGLIDRKLSVVVCPVRALLEPTITRSHLEDARVTISCGHETDLDDLVRRLVRIGFKRVPIVEEIGDFALRGGLIDFFSPGAEAPIRVELFGDEIDTIREFDVSSQRTLRRIDHVSLLPRREIPITQESLEQYLTSMPEDDAEYIRRRYLNDPELPGLEWLSVLFGLKQGCLLDYFDDDGIVVLDGEGNLRAESETILEEGRALYHRLGKAFVKLPTPEEYYHSAEKLFQQINGYQKIDRVPFRGGRKDIIDFGCRPHPSFGSRLDLVGKTVNEYNETGVRYFIATDTGGQATRLGELIAEKSGVQHQPPIEVADLKGGFVCPEGHFAILTDHEIFSRYHRRVRRKKFKEGIAVSDYSSLNYGDFIVHTDHGIARYLGLQTINVDKRHRDCLLLEYHNKDRLYVPIEEFNRVSKYSGKDAEPVLSQLGGPGWEKLQKKTRKAVEIMAADLIKLYAERKTRSGFACDIDTVWQKQLEASFIYDETPDQLKAIDDAKGDMEKERPMDRLICGDVGYGKTEVAVRAAFKAIENGKQVAVLVPTTILAQQHLQTFSERFAEFPVRIEMLSRFRTRKELLQTIDDLAAGRVEMVIGTHRLLSKDVTFKDLGLLVIDEEHRFGVRHKEKLRHLRSTIDTISMTATPIPRTLQMSMIGVRDMSIINTSPKDRLPIHTEIVEFEPSIVATAILREIDRGGQVFFVHNRVQTIDAVYRYLKKIVPQVEIAVAHGQMHEKSLEGIMFAFLSRRYDVLLCTSIIESGLDIPSANTIIINRADRFGLAQLYQIRGRVGRSSRRAFAYLVTPPYRRLKADAVKRLRALEAHSDLGSGFALAMRDLEIRGAGTLLGARQSGFIEEIGFDMYNRLLEEAIAKLKGAEVQRLPDTKLEIDIETYISEEYVDNRQQKVDIYRRLADSHTLDEVEKIRDEVIDRFGRMPQSATNLFDATAVKISAAITEIEKVKIRSGRVNLFFIEGRMLKRSEVEALRKATDCPLEFSLIGRTQVLIDLGQIAEHNRLSYLRGVLGKL